MKHLTLGIVLACVLSGTVRAGEIPTTGAPAPQKSTSLTTTGSIPSTDVPASQTSVTALTIVLTIITIVR